MSQCQNNYHFGKKYCKLHASTCSIPTLNKQSSIKNNITGKPWFRRTSLFFCTEHR